MDFIVNLSPASYDPAFGSGGEASVKAKVIHLIASIRTIMRSMFAFGASASHGLADITKGQRANTAGSAVDICEFSHHLVRVGTGLRQQTEDQDRAMRKRSRLQRRATMAIRNGVAGGGMYFTGRLMMSIAAIHFMKCRCKNGHLGAFGNKHHDTHCIDYIYTFISSYIDKHMIIQDTRQYFALVFQK